MKPCQNCKRKASLLLIATTERDEMEAKMEQASRFTIGGTAGAFYSDMIHVERVVRRDGSFMWAVRRLSSCLNKSGEWEWEPIPSDRDETFFARCRWSTSAEAMAAAEKALRAEQTGGAK